MTIQAKLRVAIPLLALAAVAPAAFADELDSLAISKDFLTLPRERLVVVEIPQPPSPEGKLKLAPTMGAVMTQTLVSALQMQLPNAQVIAVKEPLVDPPGLLVEAHFSEIVPGSRAKRFWVGFGAGKSSVEITGSLKDLATGRVVARFVQKRMSFCCGFGDNDTEIRDNLNLSAQDIAVALAGKLGPQQAYTWIEEAPAERAVPSATTTGGVLRIEASAPDADIEVDGKYVGSAPLEIPLAAGPHSIVIRKSGFLPWERSITLVEGAKQRVVAELSPEN